MQPDSATGGAAAPTRQPHAVLDLASRRWKAEKIERLLRLSSRPGPLRLLEVGTGSGGIAHYFGGHPSGRFRVDAVDVVDSRLVHDGYAFSLVHDTRLPFNTAYFDVVLSNHVIEHVGDDSQQRLHMAELRRVLRPGGIGYLAVPNRWMLVEPHFHLAFLSWLPKPWRSSYLRYWRDEPVYDCEPLRVGELEQLFQEAGLEFRNRGTDALRLTYEIERPAARPTALLRKLPDVALAPLRRIMPTLIYTFEHARR